MTRRGSVLNLTFHRVGAPATGEDSHYTLTVEEFLKVLDAVARSPEPTRLTFDDGYRSDLEVALPALLERGLLAAFFVLSDRCERPEFLGFDEMRELLRAGMEIGSHGRSHRALKSLGREALRDEIAGALQEIEAGLAVPIRQFACPFGSYDRAALAELRRAGFERVYTSDGGPADPTAWLQPRTTIHRGNCSLFAEDPGRFRRINLVRTLRTAVKRAL